jgi:hypothetical protein
MPKSFVGDISKTAVSQRAVTNKRRAVLTKQVNAGQQIVVATEPSNRDGGSFDVIMETGIRLSLRRIIFSVFALTTRNPQERPKIHKQDLLNNLRVKER